ncbi:uncharacterized protein LOC128376819 [Scomber japonicus]|uniref:uncharacterized protein LOC128376819 n=1 Tax=Scomber japonicus TaxID=13676 RepID=UPI00230546BB|nr:uncharacterized protein LOC128376819 [Scomber japonicus]
MISSSDKFKALRICISCIGLVGNVFLILSIFQTKFSRLKSFELFLLGLAAANLEEIVIVNIFDIIINQPSTTVSTWSCRSLKLLTVFGEISSILFTVLISIFRCQKLRDAHKRGNLPIFLDSIRSAWLVSGLCVMLSALLSVPTFVINLQHSVDNITVNNSDCSPDFFLCRKDYYPILNCAYKYLFILVCNFLPLIIVTVSGCLIIAVLLSQRKTVTTVVSVSGTGQFDRKRNGFRIQRSTVAVLAAMALFQVDWTIYLLFQLTSDPTDFPFWAEVEFCISTSYTSLSPYVYGIGNNLFSHKNFIKK